MVVGAWVVVGGKVVGGWVVVGTGLQQTPTWPVKLFWHCWKEVKKNDDEIIIGRESYAIN